MNFEQEINRIIGTKLDEGLIEKAITEQLEKGIKNAVDDLFGHYGELTRKIKKEIEKNITPVIENYNYSKYITKLDKVLTDVISAVGADNNLILENFKGMVNSEYKGKVIKSSELWSKYISFVEKNVEIDGLDVEYDDGPMYSEFGITMTVDYENTKSWSSYSWAKLTFECDHDENMNFEIRLCKDDRDDVWNIFCDVSSDIRTLYRLNEFQVFLRNLEMVGAKLEIESDYVEDWIQPETIPELTYE